MPFVLAVEGIALSDAEFRVFQNDWAKVDKESTGSVGFDGVKELLAIQVYRWESLFWFSWVLVFTKRWLNFN